MKKKEEEEEEEASRQNKERESATGSQIHSNIDSNKSLFEADGERRGQDLLPPFSLLPQGGGKRRVGVECMEMSVNFCSA